MRSSIQKTTSEYDREKFEERLAKLQGGVAILKVGGATEAEMKERKFRVDDAVHATRGAAEEGIVPGGGVTYFRASEAIQKLDLQGDEGAGAKVIAKALESPLENIVKNSGADSSWIRSQVREKGGSFGYNARTGEFADMLEEGVLDAVKVCRSALQNAASVSSMLLTTRAVMVELKDKKKAVAGAVK